MPTDYQVSHSTAGVTLNVGDTMEVLSGGEATGTTALGAHTTINVENNGTTTDTVLTGVGAEEFVEPGGADTNATANNATQLEIEGNASQGGVGTGAIINSGGFLLVDSGGSANTATINTGGNETIEGGGIDNNATLRGGKQFVQRDVGPGTANGTIILTGGYRQQRRDAGRVGHDRQQDEGAHRRHPGARRRRKPNRYDDSERRHP